MKRLGFIVAIFLLVFSYGTTFADFQYKISDAIAPFFDESKKVEHLSSIPFYQLDTSVRPYVDEKQFEDIKSRFTTYIEKIQEAGYTHITLDDINHLILGTEYAIYRNSPKLTRHKKYRELYHQLIDIAKQKNIGVFLVSDMQFYTPEMEDIFNLYRITPELEKFTVDMFTEILQEFPEIDGVFVRFGEGGNAYNTQEYKSKILYKTPKSVNAILKKLLPVFEKNSKKLVVRTWSVGAGSVGDFVINPKTYDAVFAGIKSKNLIASVKITPGDFFHFTQKNPTIGHGNIPQIIEIQIRKEYEGGGDFPNYVGEEYSKNIEFLKTQKNIAGVWNWNQLGGWGWGHNMLFNYGFTYWNEINFWTVGEILKGQTDHEIANRTAVIKLKKKYGLTFKQIDIIQDILRLSPKVIENNWYIPTFQKKDFQIFGVKVPPLLYIWWDRPTKSPLVLSFISYAIGDSVGADATDTSKFFHKIDEFKASFKGNPTVEQIITSLENEKKILEILKVYQKDFLHFYKTGEKQKSVGPTLLAEYDMFRTGNKNFNFDTREIQLFYTQSNLEHMYILLAMTALFFISLLIASCIGIVFDVVSFHIRRKRLLLFLVLFSVFIAYVFFIGWYKNGVYLYRCIWDMYFGNLLAICIVLASIFMAIYTYWIGVFSFFTLKDYKKSNWKIVYPSLIVLHMSCTFVVFMVLTLEILGNEIENFLPTYFQEAGTSINDIIL